MLAICIFVTMIFNLRGALFLGDSGAYASGMAISLLTIYVYNTTNGTLHADVVVVWFIVPVLDCLRLIVTRISAKCSLHAPLQGPNLGLFRGPEVGRLHLALRQL